MNTPRQESALDHVVVVMFENRSFDNLWAACTSRGRWRRLRA